MCVCVHLTWCRCCRSCVSDEFILYLFKLKIENVILIGSLNRYSSFTWVNTRYDTSMYTIDSLTTHFMHACILYTYLYLPIVHIRFVTCNAFSCIQRCRLGIVQITMCCYIFLSAYLDQIHIDRCKNWNVCVRVCVHVRQSIANDRNKYFNWLILMTKDGSKWYLTTINVIELNATPDYLCWICAFDVRVRSVCVCNYEI